MKYWCNNENGPASKKKIPLIILFEILSYLLQSQHDLVQN